jgi:exodeoxyribonuclease VII small subunit
VNENDPAIVRDERGDLTLRGTLGYGLAITCPSLPMSVPTDSSRSSPPTFESALAELEAIVARMESGALTLEESLAAHKRGLELARHCQGVLAQAQQQVRLLEEETLKALPGAESDG